MSLHMAFFFLTILFLFFLFSSSSQVRVSVLPPLLSLTIAIRPFPLQRILLSLRFSLLVFFYFYFLHFSFSPNVLFSFSFSFWHHAHFAACLDVYPECIHHASQYSEEMREIEREREESKHGRVFASFQRRRWRNPVAQPECKPLFPLSLSLHRAILSITRR